MYTYINLLLKLYVLFAAINNWLRSELDCYCYNKQTPIDILIKLSSINDDIYVFHILGFFTVIFFSHLLK